MKRSFYCTIIALIVIAITWHQNAFALVVNHLRVESQINPAIDASPHFSWQLVSEDKNCTQKSYNIKIYDGATLVYETGVVSSSKSHNVEAKGFSMSPSTRYDWTVEVEDNKGNTVVSKEDSYFDSGLMDSGWSGAQWIMYPETGNRSTGMPRFRKLWNIGNKIKRAYIYSSSLGLYDLTINGSRVGHHQKDGTIKYDELKPGWTDFRKTIYYNVHEISHYLTEGNNVIGADVTNGWWNGGISWGLYGDFPLGFIAKIIVFYEDGTNEVIVTDNTWKVTLDGPYILGDIYNGETYDARLNDEWQSSAYNDSEWSVPAQNTFFTGEMVIEKAGKVRMLTNKIRQPYKIVISEGVDATGTDYGMVKTVATLNTSTHINLKKGQTAVFDFAQNLVGYVRIQLKASEGTEIKIRYAEMLNDDGSKERGNDGPGGSLYLANLRTAKATTLYYCKGNDAEIYCPVMTYYGFRYCEVSASEDLDIESIEAIPISSVFDNISTVVTNDASLNQLFSNLQWGQLGNFVSVPTDCPQRNERWGWTGDTQVFCRTGMYNTISEAFYRKFLSDLRDCQREDGAFPDVAPYTKGRGYGRAGWGDAGIIIPWNIYLMYGNKDVLREHFDAMEKYMNWLANNHDGDIEHAGPDINYGDWLAYDECDKRYLSVAYYANDAMLMSKMSAALSESTDDKFSIKSQEYLNLYKDIKDEFNQKYWNPQPENTAQTTYLVALAFDLLGGGKKDLAIANLKEAIKRNNGLLSTGFLGTSIYLPTLSKIGLDKEAYSLLLQRDNPSWLYCIDQGATTIWERWDSYTIEKGFGPASMNSFNHYSYGAVGEWYYRYMSGIEVDEDSPGFKHIILKPSFDTREEIAGTSRINDISSCFYSVYGKIETAIKLGESGAYKYTCRIPVNTTATLFLPSVSSEYEISAPEGVECNGVINGYEAYELGSGFYEFEKKERSTTSLENVPYIINYDKGSGLLRIDETGWVGQIQIYSIGGNMLGSSNGEEHLSVKSLPNGLYVVRISNGDVRQSVKLIKY